MFHGWYIVFYQKKNNSKFPSDKKHFKYFENILFSEWKVKKKSTGECLHYIDKNI